MSELCKSPSQGPAAATVLDKHDQIIVRITMVRAQAARCTPWPTETPKPEDAAGRFAALQRRPVAQMSAASSCDRAGGTSCPQPGARPRGAAAGLQRGRNDRVAEDVGPLAEAAVARHDHRAAVIAGVVELDEQIARPSRPPDRGSRRRFGAARVPYARNRSCIAYTLASAVSG